MNEPFTYRGRKFDEEKIAFIQGLISQHPAASRWRLSKLLCEAWDWRHANGALCDQLCRSGMLALHRAGHIRLPEKRRSTRNPLAERRAPSTDLLLDESPVEAPLKTLQPLVVRQVRRTGSESPFNSLIERHHYLGYTQPVGEHLKYMFFWEDRPIACLGWCSAPWHMGPRDRFIGWPAEVRKANLRLIACNTRFLILPWFRVSHLASHILGTMARRISADWQAAYGHPVHYLETFVDQERFQGTCYKAANWVHLGETTGRWRVDKRQGKERHIKDVLGYPLHKRFREALCTVDP